MTRYLFNRSAQILLTLLVFLSLTFFMIYAQPGDTASFYLNADAAPDTQEKLRALFGQDEPVWQQYGSYIKNVFTGDFGVSFGHYPRSVISIIMERLPRTLMLFMTAAVLSFYLGFAVGKVIAWRRGGFVEYASTLTGVTLYTVFTPWFALMMIWIFAFKAGWFPLGKFLDPVKWLDAPATANFVFTRMLLSTLILSILVLAFVVVSSRLRLHKGLHVLPVVLGAVAIVLAAWSLSDIGYLAFDIVKHMVLPVATLTLISFAGTMLLTRNSMLETMREDYVVAARAKGLTEKQVRDRHVARNALLPVVTSFVFSIPAAIDGGVVIETIFSWPGMGMTMVEAVQQDDLPLAVGAFVFVGLFVLVAHLAADVLYAVLDPRIRY